MSSEPAAWGVLRVGGGWVSILANEVQAETSRKSFDKTENWVHEVAPLYRSPALTDAERPLGDPEIAVEILRLRVAELEDAIRRLPTLTDAEREAVEWCVEMASLHATECDEEIATLRGLLERLA